MELMPSWSRKTLSFSCQYRSTLDKLEIIVLSEKFTKNLVSQIGACQCVCVFPKRSRYARTFWEWEWNLNTMLRRWTPQSSFENMTGYLGMVRNPPPNWEVIPVYSYTVYLLCLAVYLVTLSQLDVIEESNPSKTDTRFFLVSARILGGGFKYFLVSPLFGEDFQFDSYFSDGLKPPTRIICRSCVTLPVIIAPI